MNFVLIGKRAAQLDTVRSDVESFLSYAGDTEKTITVCENPSELIKDDNTKIIFVNVAFSYAWEWWMSADILNDFNRKKFEDEVMEFRQFDTSICDYIIDFEGAGITDLKTKISTYIYLAN